MRYSDVVPIPRIRSSRRPGSGSLLALFLFLVAFDAHAATIRGEVKARGIRKAQDIVVYIRQAPGSFPAPAKPVPMDQKDMLFIPHVLPLVRGTTVEFLNSEVKVQHNVFSPDEVAGRFNLGTYPPGQVRKYTFDKTCPGNNTCVAVVLCHVHPEMSAYVLILQNPFFAVTARDGKFTIPNVPPGTYELVAWHEKLKETRQSITVGPADLDVALSLGR